MLVLSVPFEPNVGSDLAETCCFFVIVDGCLEIKTNNTYMLVKI